MPDAISSRFGRSNQIDVVNIVGKKDEHPMRSFFLMNFLKSPFFDKVRGKIDTNLGKEETSLGV